MPGFRTFSSNRLEALADRLADVVAEPLSSPLDSEVIVVRSRGMERWLSMRLAGRFQVWANGRFPFPNLLLQDVFRAVLHDIPESDSWSSDALAWRVMGALPGLVDLSGFEPLRSYLEDDPDGMKLMQLSERIAHTFDQYAVYRPEMVLRWEDRDQEETDWQAHLWRVLAAGHKGRHKAATGREFFEAVGRADPYIGGLPERVSIFGIVSLPPLHLDLFHALSEHVDVNLFVLNPCREYWFDMFTKKAALKKMDNAREQGLEAGDTHVEEAPPLLASCGKHGGDFIRAVIDRTDADIDESFEDPGEDVLLHCLQSDILKLHLRGREGDCKVLDPDDRSVQVHSCHGPMREIEVLHDRLLDAFERIERLAARDVLVMTPDIEAYAPYITAVFESRRGEAHIPYSIADRSARSLSGMADALCKVLGLHGGRFRASEVLDVLGTPAVLRRFGLDGNDLDRVREWVAAVRIRWGMDSADRGRQGLPPYDDNSWQAGLDRLLLGYAMPGGEERMFEGILPFDDVEGEDATVLGRLVEYTKTLFELVEGLGEARAISKWADDLQGLAERIFPADEESHWELGVLNGTLDELRTAENESGFDEPVSIEVIRAWLADRLQRDPMSAGFLAGGVTFSAMVPMRSIPFRVVALIGMNDGAFPRISRPIGFDFMAKSPQPGDPSRRDEDRYLFLEALLSARDMLYVSYIGQDVRDNSDIPPSVLVDDLLDAMTTGFGLSDHGIGIREHLLERHKLQAFNPEYFKPGSSLFSFSRDDLIAARARSMGGETTGPFVTDALVGSPDGSMEVSIGALAGFFMNSSRHFLSRRLGVRMRETTAGIKDREPFSLDGLDRYGLGLDLVRWKLQGRDLDTCLQAVRATGVLPPGEPGKAVFFCLVDEVDALVERVSPLLSEEVLPPLDVDIELGGFHVTGMITELRDSGLVRFRLARLKPRDLVRAWIEHVVIDCIRGDAHDNATHVLGKDRQADFSPIEHGREVLADLLGLYLDGLKRPVPFFPAASWEYFSKAKDDEGRAMAAASRQFWGSRWFRAGPEIEDPYVYTCFGHGDPLDSEFKSVARRVYGPVAASMDGGAP